MLLFSFIHQISAQQLRYFELLPDYDIIKSAVCYGFDKPSQIQSRAILPLIQGRNMIVQAPPGCGKTGCFAIGAFHRINRDSPSVQVIVLSPTRELSIQTTQAFKMLCFYATDIAVVQVTNGQEQTDFIRQYNKHPNQVICTTPQRFTLMLKQNLISSQHLRLVIFDEADQLLTGKSTANDCETIIKILTSEQIKQKIQFALFSATYNSNSLKKANELLTFDDEIFTNIDNQQKIPSTDLRHICYSIATEDDRQDALLKSLELIQFAQCVIFCSSREKVEQVHSLLQRSSYKAAKLHSGLEVSFRIQQLKDFQTGSTRLLVTTDVFGRGMDVRQITLVLHYELPLDKELFVHRSGRAGRFGRSGTVLAIVLEDNQQEYDSWQSGVDVKHI